jgi:hypothetical protein
LVEVAAGVLASAGFGVWAVGAGAVWASKATVDRIEVKTKRLIFVSPFVRGACSITHALIMRPRIEIGDHPRMGRRMTGLSDSCPANLNEEKLA